MTWLLKTYSPYIKCLVRSERVWLLMLEMGGVSQDVRCLGKESRPVILINSTQTTIAKLNFQQAGTVGLSQCFCE